MSTLAGLMLTHAAERPHAVAMRFKAGGVWHEVTWAALCAQVRDLACGLADAGLRAGEHLAVVGDPRPRLTAAMLAAEALGAIVVVLDAQAPAPLTEVPIRFAVVEGPAQAETWSAAQGGRDPDRRIWCDSVRGLSLVATDGIGNLDALIAEGHELDRRDPGTFDRAAAAVHPDHAAALLCPGETTLDRRGVVHTHRSLIDRARAGIGVDRLTASEQVLSALPPTGIDQHLCVHVQWLACGYVVNFPESPMTVATDLREIGPTYWVAPPAAYDALRRHALCRLDDAGAVTRGLYASSAALARRIEAGAAAGRRLALADRLRRAVVEFALVGPLRDAMGLSRLRVARSTGAASADELRSFYRLIGISLVDLPEERPSGVAHGDIA